MTESKSPLFAKEIKLFIFLFGVFLTNALLAEFVGVKIFSLEKSLGFQPVEWNLLGIPVSFNLTAGVILWPVVFILTDIVNEYFGPKGVRLISFTTAFLIAFSFAMVQWAIHLVPADFWPTSHLPPATDISYEQKKNLVGNYDAAYRLIFGQGLWIIIGSLVAFIVGQLVDVFIFQSIKRKLGSGKIWLRSTGSTIVSQLIDSFIVLFIAFYIGAGWSMKTVLAICTINYFYKFFIAVGLTPLLYIIHWAIESYLGKEKSQELRDKAMHQGID